MTARTYEPGDIVNITNKGARVLWTGVDPTIGRYINVEMEADGRDSIAGRVPLDATGVTVEHVTPAWFPPKPGQTCRDGDGDFWFTVLIDDDNFADEPYVRLRCSRRSKEATGPDSSKPDDVVREHGPLTLIHEPQPGEPST